VFWSHACQWRDSLKSPIFITFRTSVTLTLDWVIRHAIVYLSSTSIYKPNLLKSDKFFVDGRTYVWTYSETGFIRSTCRSWPKKSMQYFAKKSTLSVSKHMCTHTQPTVGLCKASQQTLHQPLMIISGQLSGRVEPFCGIYMCEAQV